MKGLKASNRLILIFYLLFGMLAICLVILLWQETRIPEISEMGEVMEGLEFNNGFDEPIQPIPLWIDLNHEKVKLGEKLFTEPRLSHRNNMSCISCHDLKTGGLDRQIHARQVEDTEVQLNTLTVFNSGFNYKITWYGQYDSLEAQLDEAMTNPTGMASNWEEAIAKLNQSPEYVKSFRELYPDGLTTNNLKDAIATFERSLYTPNSRFDRFLRGDSSALTDEEKEGYRIFKSYGCVSCHQGINVGGNLFQKFGIMGDYFADRGQVTQSDLGRFNVTEKEEDRYVFRVPSLRNIGLRYPYFHDGSAPTLEAAIGVMAKYQLGRELSPEQIKLIIDFLETLTGEYQNKLS